jgi:hypothetical protein
VRAERHARDEDGSAEAREPEKVATAPIDDWLDHRQHAPFAMLDHASRRNIPRAERE